jgi:hypothetical protein
MSNTIVKDAIEEVLLAIILLIYGRLALPIKKNGRPNKAESVNKGRLILYNEIKKAGNIDSIMIAICGIIVSCPIF